MIRVEGYQNLYRDPETGAIVDCDTAEYAKYITMKNRKKQQQEEIQMLKTELSEIKSLLKEIINGSKSN
jgi:hypothetical protein